MAEREGACRVTQHQLEVAGPDRGPAPRAAPTLLTGPTGPVLKPSSVPSEPSDRRLRERQRRWLEERTRFELLRDSDGSPSSSK